jgi:hypothetical protein
MSEDRMNRSTRLVRKGVRGTVVAIGAAICVAVAAVSLLPLAAASVAGGVRRRPGRARLRGGAAA